MDVGIAQKVIQGSIGHCETQQMDQECCEVSQSRQYCYRTALIVYASLSVCIGYAKTVAYREVRSWQIRCNYVIAKTHMWNHMLWRKFKIRTFNILLNLIIS